VAVLFAVFALIASPFSVYAVGPVIGDLDGDGQTTILDLTRLVNHLNGKTLLAATNLPLADVNGDGLIDQSDVDALASLILGIPIPPAPVTLDPAHGASEVGVTVRPKAVFPRPVNVSTLNSNNFYASFAGTKLPATIVPASNGKFAWLFFNPPMPNASQVTVTVDGSTILTLEGTALDADGDGLPSGKQEFSFITVSVVSVPGTVVSSRIVDPGPDMIPRTADDVVLGGGGYSYLLPIQGVKVYVLGMESNFAFTDASGTFTLTNMPVGDVKVVLDGRTAPNPPTGYYFPEMVMDTTFTPGITNGVMTIRDANGNVVRDANGVPIPALAIYLPRVASNVLQSVSGTTNTVITVTSNAAYNLPKNQQQYLTITVPPNSLIGLSGQPISSGQVGVAVVPPSLVSDMLPPGLLQHTFDVTVQAPGVATFTQPARMTFPNVFNAPPGTQLNFLSFDHTTGRLVIEGTGTVSADGLYVATDPGIGVTHPGWHGLAPPGVVGTNGPILAPPPNPADCPAETITAGGAVCGATYGATSFNYSYNPPMAGMWIKESVTWTGAGCSGTVPITQATNPFQPGGNAVNDKVTNGNGPPSAVADCTDTTSQTIYLGPTQAGVAKCSYTHTQTITVTKTPGSNPPHGTVTTTVNGVSTSCNW
jgi:hypothetical protein